MLLSISAVESIKCLPSKIEMVMAVKLRRPRIGVVKPTTDLEHGHILAREPGAAGGALVIAGAMGRHCLTFPCVS